MTKTEDRLLVSLVCRFGALNALDLNAFREKIDKLPEDQQRILLRALVGTFCLPKDASLERLAIERCINTLADLWIEAGVKRCAT